MKFWSWMAAGVLAASGGGSGPIAAAPEPVVLYENAWVWTGTGFAARTLAVRGGRFVAPGRADRGARRVDLSGRWVVPAYGNAHAHITPADVEGSARFLKDGVYYVWNPNTVVMDAADKAFFARPDSYDVKVAQGGITEPGGHPEKLYVEYLAQQVYPGKKRDWFVGNAFHYGSTPAEIDASLDRLRGQGADFVKIYLLHSEEWAKRRSDAAFYGQTGMNPANVAHLVRAARRRGLWVAAHVETAADLRAAADAGVAVAAHLPGYHDSTEAESAAERLSDADVRAVARSRMAVVPTYALATGDFAPTKEKPVIDTVARDRVYAAQRATLRRLRGAGVSILMGTDTWGPVFEEAKHWVAIGAFSPAEATRIVLATGAKLFPERRIGCFATGCEADFLVLGADPTRDIAALERIERRVKAGREVVSAAPKP